MVLLRATTEQAAVIARCQAYLADREIVRLRKRVDDESEKLHTSKKHAMKLLATLDNEHENDVGEMAALEQKEAELRDNLDKMSHQLSSMTCQTDEKYRCLYDRRAAVWNTLEELIATRNETRKHMDIRMASVDVLKSLVESGGKAPDVSDRPQFEVRGDCIVSAKLYLLWIGCIDAL